VAGKDFAAGTYDISVVSGNGNVSDDDPDLNAMLNAIMGTDTSNGMSLQNYSNVNFKSGVTLNISGGVTITLIPSK
jgi:hypothetical protein